LIQALKATEGESLPRWERQWNFQNPGNSLPPSCLSVVRANLLALECPPEACGKAYNVACGGATSVNDLLNLMRQRVGGEAIKVVPTYDPPQPAMGAVRLLPSMRRVKARLCLAAPRGCEQ
jgi:nucleoside-diphosphate-sugar epimerase